MNSSSQQKIAIVGLGYVGLPLALLAARKGYDVTGIDVSEERVKLLQAKQSPIEDAELAKQLQGSTATFSTDYADIKDAGIIIVCVPTPVDVRKMPDLTPVRQAVESVIMHIEPSNQLLIVESTINPGVCDEVVIPIIESDKRFKVGENIHLAHCPERINPGDTTWNVANINRVVGSNSEAGLERAKAFYESIIDAEIKAMASLQEAEAVKIVENSFRDINIAFVNELAMSFQKMGINLENVIDGAATKPFAFMPHHPGCGVGGHCIPVDPYYLIEHARDYGFEHRFLQLARDINESMPEYTIELLESKLLDTELTKKTAKVLVLGQAYKADVDDARESPAVKILSLLKRKGFDAKTYDPHVTKRSDFTSLDEALGFANAVILATGHKEFKALDAPAYEKHGIKVVVDGRNVYRHANGSFAKSNIAYAGIGVPAT